MKLYYPKQFCKRRTELVHTKCDWLQGITPSKKKKKCVEILIPITSECYVIWKYFLYEGNQFKMRLLVWTLNQ